METNSPVIAYRDLYFRIILSLVAAHLIVAFGEQQSWSELLLMPAYYISLLGSFAIAFILVCMVRWITMKLDRHHDWLVQPVKRISLQVLLVVVAPSIAAFLLAACYFGIYGVNILKTVYLRFDFPVIVLMLVLLNLYYVAFYFYQKMRTHQAVAPETDSAKSQTKEVFMVNSGARNIPLPIEEISYFFRLHDLNYVRTKEGKDYMIHRSLDEVEEFLENPQFFRVNRQLLVNVTACLHFELLPFGKLQLIVTPEFKEAIISQKRAKQFKEWIER